MQGRNRRDFRLFLRERLRHGVDRHGCGTLCCHRAFAEIRPCLHNHQKNILYYWGLLGISISISRFATRHVSCQRGKTFGFKIPFLGVIYIFLFVVLPTVLLLTAHFHILLIARKLSLQMRALMKQVRFNITANSLKIKEIRNVGLKASTVRLVSVLVTIFTACCGIGLYVFLCYTFKICFVSKHTLLIYRLLLLVNSTMNPLVYAFLKEDIKRESKAFLCRKRHVKILPFQVHPE